jgi:hypothetical protein
LALRAVARPQARSPAQWRPLTGHINMRKGFDGRGIGGYDVRAFTRKRPARKPFPAHLPRELLIVPGPKSCACCSSTRLAKLGEDVTETLEVVPHGAARAREVHVPGF